MKNILLSISGLTPQIVTETLFALSVEKKIRIDEIFVITTKRGKLVIEGKDKAAQTPKVSLLSQIKELCNNYGIAVPKFSVAKNVIVAEEESLKLYDIKTDKENILFPNKAASLIKKLTDVKDNVIYASLSGGRKSMSAHLALTMSLFARNSDKLYHVLTDEKFEFNNFYPKTEEEAKALTIAEIPFLKMRSLNSPLLKEFSSYSDLVEKTQKRLAFLADSARLILFVKKRKLEYKDKSVTLTPNEMALYLTLCEYKIENDRSISVAEIQSIDFAKNLASKLEEYFNYYFDEGDKDHWSVKGMNLEKFRTLRSKINGKLNKIFEGEEFSEFEITTERVWGGSSYKLIAPKEKIGINYD